MSMRVVIVTRIPQVLAGFDAVVRDLGHEVVALLTNRIVLTTALTRCCTVSGCASMYFGDMRRLCAGNAAPSTFVVDSLLLRS